MFKIISAELKKIVSKPGIYILSVLLAIILVLGVFIYKPTIHESTQFALKGNTYVERYTDFTADGNEDAGIKAAADTKIDNAITSINNYTVNSLTQKEHINNLLTKFKECYDAYQDCTTDSSYQSYIDNTRISLINALTSFNTAVENAILDSQEGSYSVITTKSNYELYKSTYKLVYSWANISVQKENLKEHFIEFETKYYDNFYSSIENFKYPTLSVEFIKTYTQETNGTKLATLRSRLNLINEEISKNYDIAIRDSAFNNKNADRMDELANLYVNTADTFANLVKYELISKAFSIVSTNEELQLLYLSDYSSYNAKSLLARYNYLFDNNKTEFDFARPLTIGVTSNDDINGYDYSYFVLKIFSFVIIMYAIMSACHTIAGEIKEGSMRYLAIRPITRKSMFFGKWLSILIMSTILMLFSLVISVCVGASVYGLSSKTILTIFNGSVAFTIHPLGMIGIYLASMLLELIIYSLIAMMFSSLFKSDLMSMTILLVVYLLNTLLPIFVQGANTWLAYYPFSHISLYSLFGSSIYAVPNNFFNLVFGAKIYAGTDIALTSSIILLMIVITSFIAIRVFNRKEL